MFCYWSLCRGVVAWELWFDGAHVMWSETWPTASLASVSPFDLGNLIGRAGSRVTGMDRERAMTSPNRLLLFHTTTLPATPLCYLLSHLLILIHPSKG